MCLAASMLSICHVVVGVTYFVMLSFLREFEAQRHHELDRESP